MKNYFLKFLVSCFRVLGNKKERSIGKKILIVSTTGLGDTLWATPALKVLRSHYPTAYIGVLTSSIGATILSNNPHIDEIFRLKDPALPNLLRLYPILRKKHIDTALIFHASQRPILPFCHWIGAKKIIGTEGLCKGLDDLLTVCLPKAEEHEITRRLAMVEKVDRPINRPSSVYMEIFPQEQEELFIRKFLKEKNVVFHKPIVGIHPGAKDRFKQWHPEGFIAVGRRLVEEMGCQIIVTGDLREKELVNKVANRIPDAIAIHGELNVLQLAALQKHMKLFLTNDTGPMHLAAAVGIPILALFGPTRASLCKPISSAICEIISVVPTCFPCLKKQCREPFCLLQIGAEEVFTKAARLLISYSLNVKKYSSYI